MRLLLIEDEAPVAELMRDVLCAHGHDVVIVHTGEDGLRELIRSCLDAVFLDVALPNMDGVGVLREIRALDSQVPVIVLTGAASFQQIEELERLGVRGVLQKPYALKCLSEALASLPPSAPRPQEPR